VEASVLGLSLEPQVPLRARADARWVVQVENTAEHDIALTFATAQLADVVLEHGGRECYRWSNGRAFAQVAGERTLGPGETLTLALDGYLDVDAGPYEATATLLCRPQPPSARLPVVVEPSSVF
jgi:Intracellular proteinase inhibitor